MEQDSANTFLSNSTMMGRLYGQKADNECWFDVVFDDNDEPCIQIRSMKPNFGASTRLPSRSHILLQLFEQPDTLWLASAIVLSNEPFICYAPVEPLESADGRTEIPVLAEVSLESVEDSVNDAMSSREINESV